MRRAAVVLTGAGGFIGRAIAAALGERLLAALPHDEPPPAMLSRATCLVHAGRHPSLGGDGWSPAMDIEPRLAQSAVAAGIPYVMLSTRKVLAPSDAPLDEDAPIGPTDSYGRQKLAMEERLLAIAGDRLTRLRLANIFGHERGRRTFMGAMQDRLLAEGEIRFEMSPFTVRDFLPVGHAAAAIATVLDSPPGGIVNIASGVPLETGRLALALIEGYGRGRLVVEGPAERDSFVMATGRMRALGCDVPDAAAILASARAIGRALAG